ncbi:hypothetical protein A9Q88_11450 [Gammaproteobacteria bacterium 50_400_T64]|nr:hypothetical protein A9Q88_11450 [Gammaproteobacteria bacterium 50_400_T64]
MNLCHLMRLNFVRASLVLTGLALSACATHVDVKGNFPPALTHQLPLNTVVVFNPDFASHRFESTEGPEVSISVGQIQVELFTGLAASLFEQSSSTRTMPSDTEADLILIPSVEDVQISMPNESQLKVFEVWIKYNLQVFNSHSEPIADWIMTAYGKTPTRFLKSDTEALHQASMVALRDAGAHFITGFARVPEIQQWLRNHRPIVTASKGSADL